MKNRILTIIAAIFLLTVMTPYPALAEGPEGSDEILTEIQKHYADMTTLTADYVRTTITPSVEGVFQSAAEQTASGVLMFRKPAKLILNQASPKTEKLVTDGMTVWWYIPDENVVHRYPDADVYGDLLPLLDFLNGLSGLEGEYLTKVTPAGTDGETLHRLDLTKLAEGPGPTSLIVWCHPEDYTLARFRLISLTGETTDFELSNIKVDENLPESLFIFRVPAGVEVIEESSS